MKKILLIYEARATGHHLQHPAFLAQEYLQSDYSFALHLLVPKIFQERYQSYFNVDIEKQTNVTVEYLNDLWIQKMLGEKNPIRRANIEMQRVSETLKKENITHLYLDFFNRYFFSLKQLSPLNVKISGIYYAPYPRIKRTQGVRTSIKYVLNRVRKWMQLYLVTQNRNLQRLFVLNDPWSANYLNKQLPRLLFKPLPDPIWQLRESTQLSEFDIRKHYKIPDEKKIFLIFGAISAVKGCLEVLAGLKKLNTIEHSSITLLIAGKLERKFCSTLKKALEETQFLCPDLQICCDNRFFDATEMCACFHQCDAVLNINTLTQSSSGIMGHSAVWGKPAITSSTGLYGDLAREYRLGPLANPLLPHEVAEGFRKIIFDYKNSFNMEDLKRYCNERKWDYFARTILEEV